MYVLGKGLSSNKNHVTLLALVWTVHLNLVPTLSSMLCKQRVTFFAFIITPRSTTASVAVQVLHIAHAFYTNSVLCFQYGICF